MANTDEVFEVYVRNQDGDTYHCPLREGIKMFLDTAKGYRLTINIEGVAIVLRRNSDVEFSKLLDGYLNQESVDCVVSIRGHK